MRRVFLGAALAVAAATSAQAGGPGDSRTVVIASGQFTCPGSYGDYRATDWRAGYGQRPWRCDFPTRPHRDSLEDGFFGHGRIVGTHFDYDRGYPYDYYPAWEPELQSGDYAEMDMASPPVRDTRCETVRVPDGSSSARVPVRICRN